jgi:hypothetical protein
VFFGLNQAKEFAAIDEAVFEQVANELDVFFPACRQLAEGEVVHFEAQTDSAARIEILARLRDSGLMLD